LVTRYEDVARLLKDGTFAKDRLNTMYSEQLTKTLWIPGFLKPLERNMLDLDDPDHARLRAREQGVHPTPHRAAAGAHRGTI
jgi:cytochrome P450